MAQHNEIGKWGELIAREYLIKKGYAIVDTNTRVGHYELDIVAIDHNRAVFIEVKTRSEGEITDPLEAIDNKKMRYLSRAAEAYIRQTGLPYEVRFDVIAIVGTPQMTAVNVKVMHLTDAFRPPMSTR